MAHPILLNIDCWDLYRGRVTMDRAGLLQHLHSLCRAGVSDLLLNVNAQKAMYPSAVWQREWDDADPSAEGSARCRQLHEAVPDAEQYYIDQGRALGRKVHLSMRMNDLHGVSIPESAGRFWREHRQHWRAPFYDPNHWYSKALDYGAPAVRRHMMSLIAEILERFDCDGLELDWVRHPFQFRPGMEEQGREILTQFMRDVRQRTQAAARRSGRPLELSVRVPARPEDARRMGYAVVEWSQENLIDRVIPTSIHPTTDYDMPLELWKMLLARTTRLAAGLEFRADSLANYWGEGALVTSAEIFFGHVVSFLHRGADEIYLYNYFNPATFGEDNWLQMMTRGASRQAAEAQARRHIVTYCDSRAPGLGSDPVLPLRLSYKGQFEPVRLNVGSAAAGRRGRVILGFPADQSKASACQVRLNGGDALAPADLPQQGYPPYVARPTAFEIAPGMLHDGDNVIDIGQTSETPLSVNWCEIRIEAD